MFLWWNEWNRLFVSGIDFIVGKIVEFVILGIKCVVFFVMCFWKMFFWYCLVCLIFVEINIEGIDKLFIIYDLVLFVWLIIC